MISNRRSGTVGMIVLSPDRTAWSLSLGLFSHLGLTCLLGQSDSKKTAVNISVTVPKTHQGHTGMKSLQPHFVTRWQHHIKIYIPCWVSEGICPPLPKKRKKNITYWKKWWLPFSYHLPHPTHHPNGQCSTMVKCSQWEFNGYWNCEIDVINKAFSGPQSKMILTYLQGVGQSYVLKVQWQ